MPYYLVDLPIRNVVVLELKVAPHAASKGGSCRKQHVRADR